LSSETVKANFDHFIAQMRLNGKRPVVQLVPEKRSLDQNDMIHAIYQQVAQQKQDESFNQIRCHCKLHHGVPILRRDDETFRYVYDTAVKHLPYEFKLVFIDPYPVTSEFNKKQATEYIDEIIREYSQQGLCLVHPSELTQ
jgi:pseudouridine-5'-phosphate glycosidase